MKTGLKIMTDFEALNKYRGIRVERKLILISNVIDLKSIGNAY